MSGMTPVIYSNLNWFAVMPGDNCHPEVSIHYHPGDSFHSLPIVDLLFPVLSVIFIFGYTSDLEEHIPQ